MKETGEWGESFPPSCATTPYNLSVAQFFRPLEKDEALRQGYSWRDEEKPEQRSARRTPPDSVAAASDALLGEPFDCAECGRQYKIITQELVFYRDRGLPLPQKCFLCRHPSRLSGRTPRRLWKRSCSSCDIDPAPIRWTVC
jgi:hypothetical protein